LDSKKFKLCRINYKWNIFNRNLRCCCRQFRQDSVFRVVKVFKYIIIEEGPLVQIMYGDNIIDESGPWESLTAAISWADEYVLFKNSGIEEPYIA